MGCRAVPEFGRVHRPLWTTRAGLHRWINTQIAHKKGTEPSVPKQRGDVLMIHPRYDFRICRCSVFHWNVLGGTIALLQSLCGLTATLVAGRWREPHSTMFASSNGHWFPVDGCICGHRAAEHTALSPTLEEGAVLLETERSFRDFHKVHVRYLVAPTENQPVPMPPTGTFAVASAARWHRLLIHHCLPAGRDERAIQWFIRSRQRTGNDVRAEFVQADRRLPATVGHCSLASL